MFGYSDLYYVPTDVIKEFGRARSYQNYSQVTYTPIPETRKQRKGLRYRKAVKRVNVRKIN